MAEYFVAVSSGTEVGSHQTLVLDFNLPASFVNPPATISLVDIFRLQYDSVGHLQNRFGVNRHRSIVAYLVSCCERCNVHYRIYRRYVFLASLALGLGFPVCRWFWIIVAAFFVQI